MDAISIAPEAAHNFINTLIILGSTGRALSPARKAVLFDLSQRLKIEQAELVKMATERNLIFAVDKQERAVTYLAAAVLLAIDHQANPDQGLLAKLASAYEMTGPGLDKINKLAQGGPPLLDRICLPAPTVAENAPAPIPAPAPYSPIDTDYSPLAAPVAPLLAAPAPPTNTAPAGNGFIPLAAVPASPTEPEELPTFVASAKPVKKGISERGKRARKSSRPPKMTKEERKKKLHEDAQGRAKKRQRRFIALCIAFPLVLTGVLLAVNYFPSRGESGRNKGAAVSRYNGIIDDFNRFTKKADVIPIKDMAALKDRIDAIILETKTGNKEDRKLAAELQTLLKSTPFERLWQGSVAEAIDRLALELSQARNAENFPRAKEALKEIQAAYLTTTELRRDYDRLSEAVSAWETFTVAATGIMAQKQNSITNVKKAYWLVKRTRRVSSTPAFKRLMTWFSTQRSQSNVLFQEFVKSIEENDAKTGLPILEMLEYIEPNVQDFFAAKNEELEKSGTGFNLDANKAIGTGFFVTHNLILTNSHVVGHSKQVKIQMQKGDIQGKVIAHEKDLDLALISVKESGAAMSFCKSSIRPGQTVFAYGYGQLGSMNATLLLTKGTLSAVKESQIVFDAKVNPGNSGGPLLDSGGRWLGVVVAKSIATESVDSFGFAIHGNKVIEWLEKNKVFVSKLNSPATGQAPPTGTSDSIVRIEALSIFGE
jgi:S1-C subfamily serine protease